jgi:predicted Ser/Thr protein kinase
VDQDHPEGAEPPDDDSLYDAWLDRALAGEVEDPADYCARHGCSGGTLEERLTQLVRSMMAASIAPTPFDAAAGAAAGAAAADGSPAVPRMAAEPGLPFDQLDGFRLLRVLGEGGMGVVYLAEQERLGRLVALKVIRPELAASPTAVTRFSREARSLARLRHRHVVSVLDAGDADGVLWFAMELVPGRSLASLLAESPEPLDIARVVRWGRDVARALQAAHTEGLVHRDVKPGNVRIASDDRALLIDFGLVRDLTGTDATLSGSFAGSPAYAPPEQLEGSAPIDARTDVYALGATLYEALTRRVPFEAETLVRLAHRIASEDPPPPRRLRGELPRDLETVLLTALERDPERRYASADALARDLDAVLGLRPIAAEPPGPLRRLGKWARRNRSAAAVLVLGAGAALVATAALVLDARNDRLEAEREAQRLVSEAATLLEAWDGRRGEAEASQWEATVLQTELGERWLEREDITRLDAAEAAVSSHERRRAETFARALAHLSEARRLDPDAEGLDAGFAAYYLQRWLDTRGDEDTATAEFFRGQVLHHDPDGTWAAAVRGTAPVAFDSDPPGARVTLFRWAVEGEISRMVSVHDPVKRGEPRLVLVPTPDPSAREQQAMPVEQAETRDDALLGVTPLAPREFLPGWYLAWMDAPGRLPQAVSFHVDHAVEHYSKPLLLSPRLLRPDEAVEGFTWIGSDALPWLETSYFMQTHEVTVAEYATFLRDLALEDMREAQARAPIAPPASGPTHASWLVLSWGAIETPRGVEDDHPVLGVRWDDAHAYARWWDERINTSPERLWSDLPTRQEYLTAGYGGDGRDYPFGNTFRPGWVSSRFGKEQAGPSPVGSHTVDRSPVGVLDLAGSAAEWLADEVEDGRRLVAGGSWNESDAEAFLIRRVRTVSPTSAEPSFGFRLVLRPRPGVVIGGEGP